MDTRLIGVFDSGMGGISILREMTRILPGESFLYYGDNANAPYGTRPKEEILRLSRGVVSRLLARDIKALVIACNTATSAAAETLRRELTLPVIGVEPALKPAALYGGSGAILVLATPATLRLEKFARLMEQYGQRALPVPCPGLMEFVERGETDSPALHAFLKELLSPYRGTDVAACVLGCTHYPFVRRAIERELPGVPMFDGSEGTARQLKRVLEQANLLSGAANGQVLFDSSDASALPRMRALYEMEL